MKLIGPDEEVPMGYSKQVCSTWAFNSNNMSRYQRSLFQLIEFLKQVVSSPEENDQPHFFPPTVWHRIKETCSTWNASSDKLSLFHKILDFIESNFSFNFKSAPKKRNWLATSLFMLIWIKTSFYVYVNLSSLIRLCESAVPVTCFTYIVESKNYLLQQIFCHYFSCLASQVATIFTFTSNQSVKHSLLRYFPIIRTKN